jgi:hypothetical protein
VDHVSTKDRAEFGPFDSEEVAIPESYRDFGALLVPANLPDVVLRIEVEEGTDRGIALTLETETSSLQLTLYSAPKSSEIWPEVMEQLEAGLLAQGASVQREVHAFGLSLRVEQSAEGVSRLRRFVGVDGPRWFMRGVLAGNAVEDLSESAFLESIMRSAIVRRGDDPMPPRELIPLTLPPGTIAPPRSV